MINVILHGSGGKMCHKVAELIEKEEGIQVIAGVDPCGITPENIPVFKDLNDLKYAHADVVIDFSNAAGIDKLLDFCAEKKLPIVICTTGLSEDQLKHMEEASDKVAILRSANMTLGINLLMDLLKKAAPMLAEAGFDIEIVEKHHNQKVDAPSGTAIALADAINDEMDRTYSYIYDRSQKREKRRKQEIGISAVRGGTIVGDHDVIFAGEDEVITLSHRAYSKTVFAKGAIQAAKFLAEMTADPEHNLGIWTMADVIEWAQA